MLSELIKESECLNLSVEERGVLIRATEEQVLTCGKPVDDLLSVNPFDRRLCAMAVAQRLYDISKGYTFPMQVGTVVCQHSSYTELPLSRNTRIKMLKFGRVELKDVWKIALHNNFYDATDAILHIKELGVIKYQPRKDSVEC